MADEVSAYTLRREAVDGDACAPALLRLSPALPSSVEQLGLTLSSAQPPATPVPAATATASNTSASPNPSPPAAPTAVTSPSFVVRAVHFDDAAQDAILVCDGCITLFVPLQFNAVPTPPSGKVAESTRASVPGSASLSSQQEQRQEQEERKREPAPAPAVAACLRLGNPHQAWTLPPRRPPPASSPTSQSPPSTDAVADERCLPRRLPLPAEVLRRVSSVLVAVPVFARPSPATPAGGTAEALVSIMSIVIVECVVLPDSVDFMEANAIPLARPLKRILCAPNTLRFREAWYPIQHFCWCGPTEMSSHYGERSASSDVPYMGSGNRPQVVTQGDRVHQDACVGGGAEEEEAGVSSVARVHASCTDYYLLCVSSICVDLLRVRYQAPSPAGHDLQRKGGSGPSYLPDVTSMLNAGYTARAPPQSQHSKTSPFTGQVPAAASKAAEVVVKLMQRYVTHTDWCVYETRSRVLLSVHHTRPDVLKPISVQYDPCCITAARNLGEEGVPGRAPSPSLPVSVSLCKWPELTLPERLCASLSLQNAAAAPLPQDASTARHLHSVVGVFTVYGHTFFYHVPSARTSSRRFACMDVYLFLPDEACSPMPLSPLSSSSPPAPDFDRERAGAAVAERHGGRADANDGAGDARFSPPSTSSPANFLKRLTTAASSATASAAPPQVHGGTFMKVAQLSMGALLSPAASPAFSLNPLRSGGAGGPPMQQPLPQLSVQVWCDLLLLHSPHTGRSAVYDLMGWGDGSPSSIAEGGRALSSRDYILWATASERSRHWARSRFSCSSPSPSPTGSLYAAVGAAGGARTAGSAATSTRENGYTHYNGASSSDQLWLRAATGDWASMMSAVASSVMEFSSASQTIAGEATTAASAQAPLVLPLFCCAATVDVRAGRSGSGGNRDTPSFLGDAEGERDGGCCAATPVLYTSYVWPTSSRTPLAISKHDGSLRLCQVDAAALAEWMLRLHPSQASPSSCLAGVSNDNSRVATTSEDGADARSAPLSHLIALACRHPALLNEPADDGSSNADMLFTLLRELVVYLVCGARRTPSPHHSTHSTNHPAHVDVSYCDALQRHLHSAMAESPGALCSHLGALFEVFTLEAELHDRFTALARQRMLSLVMPGITSAGTAKPACCHRNSTNRGSGMTFSGAQLQLLLVNRVWGLVWRVIKSKGSLGEGGGDPDCHQRQRQLQRYEEVLCGYVRLLHRLALPVLPAVQELLLEVVLRCDLGTGWTTPTAASSAPAMDVCTRSAAAPMASVSGTARRVQVLLRQGVLEQNCTTARSLLEWWQRSRCQLAAVQSGRQRRPPVVEITEEKEEGERDPRERKVAPAQPDLLLEGGCPDAEALFQEAMHLFALHGHHLEVAEAYRWRHDYTAAAAVLLRLSRDTPPIELCEVHGSWRSLSQSNTICDASPPPTAAAAAATAPGSAETTPRRTSHILSWDALAIAVLDGAWSDVLSAENSCYVLTERAAAGARSRTTPTNAGSPSSSPGGVSTRVVRSPPTWQLRAAEREVQAAHRLYLSVATSILSAFELTAVTAADPTTELHSSSAEGGVGGPRPHLHSYRHDSSISSGVSAGYHAHGVRCLQLRQQLEMDWRHMKSGVAQ
ncbi:hypothetical protein ABL78_4934 [Leptomonas seymouri]|uniref:Uncharacterized protein n=1 Tax=Leptomonas seymouri TaxID=5684 RepID=A0A0N1I5N4_LEPSE|nr:hypothetical protein ABL78_4934 [Leptomonas seymouri]|eukprot:KPI86001.1 hypothetical protein ABL78_4934 [Leptomonas seymouri]